MIFISVVCIGFWFMHEKLNFSETLRSGNKYCEPLSELAKKTSLGLRNFHARKEKEERAVMSSMIFKV